MLLGGGRIFGKILCGLGGGVGGGQGPQVSGPPPTNPFRRTLVDSKAWVGPKFKKNNFFIDISCNGRIRVQELKLGGIFLGARGLINHF
jgi:hypothetical protein